MIKSLIFFMVEIRPNITFVIFIISRFTRNSSQQNTKIVKIIIQYLKVIKLLNIIYNRKKSGNLIIKGNSNFDRTNDNIVKKSILRFIFMLNTGPIS